MKISIMGCGWLGLPLAEELIRQGHKLKGSTTRNEKLKTLRNAGIEDFLLQLTPEPEGNIDTFLNSEILVVNVPPSSKKGCENFYSQSMQQLIEAIEASPVQKVIFIGATSVYPLNGKTVTEKDAEYIVSRFSDVVWLEIEELFTKNSRFDTTILRFSGLMGPGRQPGRYFAGKKMAGADAPVNMIHLTDCVRIICEIIRKEVWGETFNASADEHPSRREFYTKACQTAGLENPVFVEGSNPFRTVNSDKLKKLLNYKFQYPNPTEALQK